MNSTNNRSHGRSASQRHVSLNIDRNNAPNYARKRHEMTPILPTVAKAPGCVLARRDFMLGARADSRLRHRDGHPSRRPPRPVANRRHCGGRGHPIADKFAVEFAVPAPLTTPSGRLSDLSEPSAGFRLQRLAGPVPCAGCRVAAWPARMGAYHTDPIVFVFGWYAAPSWTPSGFWQANNTTPDRPSPSETWRSPAFRPTLLTPKT